MKFALYLHGQFHYLRKLLIKFVIKGHEMDGLVNQRITRNSVCMLSLKTCADSVQYTPNSISKVTHNTSDCYKPAVVKAAKLSNKSSSKSSKT
jgi:hypothetical protein